MRALFVLFLIFVTTGPATGAEAQVACPLGVGEDHLTLQRVMMNFGKYTTAADTLVSTGQIADSAVAVSDLSVAAACADTVVTSASEDLLPSQAHKLAGAERDRYVTDFKQAMAQFATALQAYGTALQNGDLTDAQAKKKLIGDLADQAHARF